MISTVIASAMPLVVAPVALSKPGDDSRSPYWPAVRRRHIALHPSCAACGGRTTLQVHHIRPFHLHPELELDPANLLTLCESSGHNCHFTFGHFFDWRAFNPDVVIYAAEYLRQLRIARGGILA